MSRFDGVYIYIHTKVIYIHTHTVYDDDDDIQPYFSFNSEDTTCLNVLHELSSTPLCHHASTVVILFFIAKLGIVDCSPTGLRTTAFIEKHFKTHLFRLSSIF